MAHDLCEDEARCRGCRLNGKCRSGQACKAEEREKKRGDAADNDS
ncbi:MAG: hypothetical protein PHF64_00320 [Methanoregula sp.]|nr:hypothetical protein [Methanoregula sp.]